MSFSQPPLPPRLSADPDALEGQKHLVGGCGTILAVGGILGIVVAVISFVLHGMSEARDVVVLLFMSVPAALAGVYLGALASANFDRSKVAAEVPRVLTGDLLSSGVIFLVALLSGAAGSGGGHGGGSGGGGGGSGRAAVEEPRRENFATRLVDEAAVATTFAVPAVKVTPLGPATPQRASAMVRSVGSRGRPANPSLRVTVVQGRGAEVAWRRNERNSQPLGGPGDTAVVTGTTLAYRRTDTVVELRLRGWKGDATTALQTLAASVDARLMRG